MSSCVREEILTKGLLYQTIVCEGNTHLLHFAVATFVDELPHRLQVGVSEYYQKIVIKVMNIISNSIGNFTHF